MWQEQRRVKAERNANDKSSLSLGVNKSRTGPDRIRLTEPGLDRTGLTKPGSD